MKYTKEVTEARKVYDSLVIEQREAKKELEAVKAEIRAKLEGKHSPHKYEELKKQEAKLEARLADLPVLIADARDALIVALNEQARGLGMITPKELETSMDKILKPCEKFTAAMDELEAAIVKEAERLSEITGEKISINIEDLLKRACENYLTDRGAGFKVRLLSRITQQLSNGINNARYLLTNEAERLRPKKSIWA
jgi:ABC-type transport system involved in cytochrome bd biosynthesis fused ATPase/permease subunit